jgi:hypothetical protein
VRRQLTGRAVHVAVGRRNRQRLVGLRLEFLRLVLDERERRDERVRLEARRVHGEGFPQRFVRLVVVPGVGGFAGEEDVRVN